MAGTMQIGRPKSPEAISSFKSQIPDLKEGMVSIADGIGGGESSASGVGAETSGTIQPGGGFRQFLFRSLTGQIYQVIQNDRSDEENGAESIRITTLVGSLARGGDRVCEHGGREHEADGGSRHAAETGRFRWSRYSEVDPSKERTFPASTATRNRARAESVSERVARPIAAARRGRAARALRSKKGRPSPGIREEFSKDSLSTASVLRQDNAPQ